MHVVLTDDANKENAINEIYLILAHCYMIAFRSFAIFFCYRRIGDHRARLVSMGRQSAPQPRRVFNTAQLSPPRRPLVAVICTSSSSSSSAGTDMDNTEAPSALACGTWALALGTWAFWACSDCARRRRRRLGARRRPTRLMLSVLDDDCEIVPVAGNDSLRRLRPGP